MFSSLNEQKYKLTAIVFVGRLEVSASRYTTRSRRNRSIKSSHIFVSLSKESSQLYLPSRSRDSERVIQGHPER